MDEYGLPVIDQAKFELKNCFFSEFNDVSFAQKSGSQRA